MNDVIFTALLVGGATIISGATGLLFRKVNARLNSCLFSSAAGIMLSASIVNLILPSAEIGGAFLATIGIFAGAFLVNAIDLFLPYLSFSLGVGRDERWRSSLLFVLAITMHNLPEGIAAGVGLGAGEGFDGFILAIAIALQNLPEGIIVTAAMLDLNAKPALAFLISAFTGVVEIIGTFVGYFALGISSALLPLILALAGGAMLYVICEELIPECQSTNGDIPNGYFLLAGFSLMLILDAII